MKIGDRCIVIGVVPFDVPDDHVVLDLKTFPCLGSKPCVLGPAGREDVYVMIFQKSSVAAIPEVLAKCFPDAKAPKTLCEVFAEEAKREVLQSDIDKARAKLDECNRKFNRDVARAQANLREAKP